MTKPITTNYTCPSANDKARPIIEPNFKINEKDNDHIFMAPDNPLEQIIREVLNQVVGLLAPLDNEARLRVLTAARVFYGVREKK